MGLNGVPKENGVLLCVKAALAQPQLVDEYIVLVSKKTGIPQFNVSLTDLEEALSILSKSSVFWPKARALGFGAKFGKPVARKPNIRPRHSSSSSSNSSDSDSDSSSSSSSDGGECGLDLGFSEDEAAAVPEPVKPVAKRTVQKRKPKTAAKQDSDEEMDSPSSEDEPMQSTDRARDQADHTNGKSSESSSDTSSDSSNDSGPATSKKTLKKKLAGLAAQRRAQQAADAKPKSAPKDVPKISTSSSPDSGEANAKPARKLRQPYAYSGSSAKENVRPPPQAPTSPAEPQVKKPRVETGPGTTRQPDSTQTGSGPKRQVDTVESSSGPKRQPDSTQTGPGPKLQADQTSTGQTRQIDPKQTSSAPTPQESPKAVDWSSDFGRLVRQAIDNRRICPFRTLGLGPASTMAEVKKRWAKLCLLLHPDKAPVEWKTVPELVDANQAVNEAKKSIEQRFQAAALVRPQRPLAHAQPFTLDKGTFGKRRVEIRWMPSRVEHAREKVEKYLVFIVHGGQGRRDQMLNAGSVKEGTDPFFVVVEDDQRFARFFAAPNITVSILASNAAGNSDPLTVSIPLR